MIMLRPRDYAISQYDSVANYMKSLGVKKPIHIGETGWATFSNGLLWYTRDLKQLMNIKKAFIIDT